MNGDRSTWASRMLEDELEPEPLKPSPRARDDSCERDGLTCSRHASFWSTLQPACELVISESEARALGGDR